MADLEPEFLRKVFIGGLSPETTDDSLRSYFSKYGDIVDSIVMRDNTTKRSRGFGFVTFSKSSMVDAVQDDRPHTLDNKGVETKRVVPKNEQRTQDPSMVKKVFVGGVKEQITEQDLQAFFTDFGPVEKIETFTDKDTGRKKGFAFVTFEDYDAVDKCILKAQSNHDKKVNIQGVKVECKKARSQAEMKNGQMPGGMGRGGGMLGRGGHGGGRGGGMGGRGGGGNYGRGNFHNTNYNQGNGFGPQGGGYGGGDFGGNRGGGGGGGGNYNQGNFGPGGNQGAYGQGGGGGYNNNANYGNNQGYHQNQGGNQSYGTPTGDGGYSMDNSFQSQAGGGRQSFGGGNQSFGGGNQSFGGDNSYSNNYGSSQGWNQNPQANWNTQQQTGSYDQGPQGFGGGPMRGNYNQARQNAAPYSGGGYRK